MAPMRPEYLVELAKIHEPPEMADKPMQVRRAVSPKIVQVGYVISAIGSPDKATHDQRVTAVRELLKLANTKQMAGNTRVTYGAVASIACIDGDDPQAVIRYTNMAIGGDDDDDMLALRARMYLKEGEHGKALDDLERIMADNEGSALLLDDGVAPRKESDPCSWSIADLDAFGNDPRALAAKGLYLSSFIGFGAEDKGAVRESDIRNLYARSAAAWHSPIPHFLAVVSLDGLGSEELMSSARCLRANDGGGNVPDIVGACGIYDESIRRDIRELTMALVIEPTFAPALSYRANEFLKLAQGSYADGKPSRKLFELAIADFSAALATGGREKHELYCDRALALASIGRYRDAATGYLEGMKHAKNGIEDSPFVYEQLFGVYMKLGRFKDAADTITQAIMNASGGGMDAVILGGGMRTFRALYPEYDLLPDEILVEDVRRRYEPQFPESWDADFTSNKGKVLSTILPDLYAMRGDAYMKAGRPAAALADYNRLKSDAWASEGQLLPRNTYFTARGSRNYELPERWPSPPAMF
jgi:tetratricopeptide (TPR) repeat protein